MATELHITPWRCPVCVGGLTAGDDGQGVERCLHCAGSGLTGDPCGPAERAPRPPGVMRTPCADCAFRRDSPELEACGAQLPDEEPFFCHQGLYVSASGKYVPTAMFRGLPLGAMVCAGWWAMKTGEALPAKPYREIPITEDQVEQRWAPPAYFLGAAELEEKLDLDVGRLEASALEADQIVEPGTAGPTAHPTEANRD